MLRIGFIGTGRLAHALAPAIAAAGYQVVPLLLQHPGPLLPQRERLGEGSSQSIADLADLVFLAVPDGAISEVADSIHWREGQFAVHCSGAGGLDLLSQAAAQGAQTGSFHPLQTFATGQPANLDGVTVAIEADEPLAGTLEGLARDLGCYALRLPAGAKPLYHASAAMAGNYVVSLVAQAARLWQAFGFSQEQALAALLPLVRTTVDNLGRLGPAAALTGPVARGDTSTVCGHLDALSAQAPEVVDLYRQLALAALTLADLDPDRAGQLRTILQGDMTPCA